MIKLEVSSEFWKMYIHYHDEPDSFQIPKDTCSSDSNKCDILILNKRNMSTFEDLYNSLK